MSTKMVDTLKSASTMSTMKKQIVVAMVDGENVENPKIIYICQLCQPKNVYVDKNT